MWAPPLEGAAEPGGCPARSSPKAVRAKQPPPARPPARNRDSSTVRPGAPASTFSSPPGAGSTRPRPGHSPAPAPSWKHRRLPARTESTQEKLGKKGPGSERARRTEPEMTPGRVKGSALNLHSATREEAAPERGAPRGNKEEPGWGRALPGCRVTDLPGDAPARPPEREPPRRGRRGRAGGKGARSRGKRCAGCPGRRGRREARGFRRRGAEARRSAAIMTPGGFTAPEPRPSPSSAPLAQVPRGGGRAGGGPGMIHLECGSGWCTAQDTPDWDCGDVGSPACSPYPDGSGPKGSRRPPCVAASCPRSRVPLAEVRPDALPPHRPLSPELAEVCVALRFWKFDPGLGEGKCVWIWDALWGHWMDLPRGKVR